MKSTYLSSLLATLFLFLFAFTLSAQEAKPVADQQITRKTTPFKYSGVSISSPAIYAGEDFSIDLIVSNTGKEIDSQEVKLYLKDAVAPNQRKEQAKQVVSLEPGYNKAISFVMRAEDLIVPGQSVPEAFVFYLGNFEIGVDYIKE
ncbi:MAG: hypothetical protein AAF840_03180 [Bacteroidota bacterium]